MSAVALLQTLR